MTRENPMTGRCRRRAAVLIFASMMLAASSPRRTIAQEKSPAAPGQLKQIRQIQENAELIGTWDEQYLLVDEAAGNIFEQQGWNSQADLYAKQLMGEISRIPPWKPLERQKVFMDALQVRYSLTEDQRGILDRNVQREAMLVTAKHFKDMMPVAMEIIRTRANGEPFSAAQVQRWSKAIKPLMADTLRSTKSVTEKLKKSLSPKQRKTLEADMEALLKRHRDVEKMVKRWEAGKWSPADWGLQNDAIHAGVMAEIRSKDEEKTRLVEEAESRKPLDENIKATDESAWDIYVKRFCTKYQCSDTQRTSAQAILKKSKQEAFAYRSARRDHIEKYEQLLKNTDSPEKRKLYEQELQTCLAPVGEIFVRLKGRLHSQVLTTEQRLKFGPPARTAAKAND